MPDPVSLTEAKLFLRVTHTEEDSLIATLLDAAQLRLEGITGLILTDTSPAPLRLCLLYLLAQSYTHRGETIIDDTALNAWLSPYRTVRI
jgi:hypothetical protein